MEFQEVKSPTSTTCNGMHMRADLARVDDWVDATNAGLRATRHTPERADGASEGNDGREDRV